MTLPMQKDYYAARASSTPISFGESQNGNAQVAIEFEICDERFPDETITWIGHLTDNTAARTIEALQIAGWKGDDISELDGLPASQVLTEEVSLVCEPEEWEGKWQLKVQWVNSPKRGRFKFKTQITGNDLKVFGAKLRATVQAVRASGGAPNAPRSGGAQTKPAQARHPNAPAGIDDDIPF